MSEEPCPDENELLEFATGTGSVEFEAHIARCTRCRETIAMIVTSGPAARGNIIEKASQVGRYSIVGLIGEGGMGRVYVAFDPVLDRTVALKMLHPLGEGAQARAALLREAQALARVSHPNLVTAHDAGEVDGVVFVAMEFVDGSTLRSWRNAKPRTEAEVLAVYLQAARGLAAIHDAGLVHRDFKPDNVLIGADGRVRVADFGLARGTASAPPITDLAADPSTTRTLTSRAGTPAYMAPEQLKGRVIDARADQFAFCCALAEALTGTRPFRDNATEPGQRTLELPGVSSRTSRVLRRGLDPDLVKRFSSMHELVAALEPPRFSALQLGALVLAVAVVIAVGVGLATRSRSALCRGSEARSAAVFSPARRTQLRQHFASLGPTAAQPYALVERALDQYLTEWNAMARDNCEATRVRGEQPDLVLNARNRCLDRRLVELGATIDVLDEIDRASVQSATDVLSGLTPVRLCTEGPALQRPSDAPENPKLASQVEAIERELATAVALYEAGRLDQSLALATQVQAEAKALPWPSREAEAMLVKARVLFHRADPTVEASLRDAWLKALLVRDDRLAAEVGTWLASLQRTQAHLKEALEWQFHAEAMRARVTGDLELIETSEAEASRLALAQNDVAAARTHSDAVLAAARQSHGENHPHTGRALVNLGVVESWDHHFEDALRLRRAGLAIDVQFFGKAHPLVGGHTAGLAEELLNLNRPAEAQTAIDDVLPAQLEAYGPDSTQVAVLLQPKAIALRLQGHFAESLELVDQARATFEAKHVTRPQAWAMIDRADVLGSLDRLDEAHEQYAQAREFITKNFGADDSDLTVSFESECEQLLSHDKARAAWAVCSEAMKRRQAEGDETTVGYALSLVGRAHQKLGQRDLARDELKRAIASLEASNYDSKALAAARSALAAAQAR